MGEEPEPSIRTLMNEIKKQNDQITKLQQTIEDDGITNLGWTIMSIAITFVFAGLVYLDPSSLANITIEGIALFVCGFLVMAFGHKLNSHLRSRKAGSE